MIRKKFLLFLCALVLLPTACAVAPPSRPPNPLNPVYTVAVLPVYNITNDVGGPEVTRSIAEKFISNLHYKSVPLKRSIGY